MAFLAVSSLPLLAAGTDGVAPATSDSDGFGQYLADHQTELTPFFEKNAGDLFKLGVPLLLGMVGWIILLTTLAGWVVDVLMGRGYTYFFAPASSSWQRSLLYATGRLVLTAIYTCLMGLVIVFSLKLSYPGLILAIAVPILVLVALAAQIVWILFLFRTNFLLSAAFYLVLIVVHSMTALLFARPMVGAKASSVATDFVDHVIAPRLQAEVQSTKHDLAAVETASNVSLGKTSELQNQIAGARTEDEQLRQEIEQKKNSDIYIFSRIVQAQARGELGPARDQFTEFLAKFPASPLDALARTQLAQVVAQMTSEDAEKKQAEADAARAAAGARADLLARAGRGEVTLSEMRQVLIGKSRAEVSSLLGPPSETASDRWGYRRQMIVNPLTNERHGLMVNFSEGTVQGVDYDRNGGPQ